MVLAERQHGIVAHHQLLAMGFSASMVNRWVDGGRLFRRYRGVFSTGRSVISQEGHWLAAVLAIGRGAFLSHGSAGQLQGLISRRERLALHVSIQGRKRREVPGIVTHRPRNLDFRDTTTRLQIPTTTAARTVWDLASTLSSLQTRRAFERAEGSDMPIRPRLAQLLEASPNRRGAGKIRQLLAELPLPLSETRSWLEGLLLTTCRDHGLPLPAVNVPLLGYEVDFLWPEARFVVEADGGDHLNPEQRDRDNARDITLGRAGYLVRRYSSGAMGNGEAVTGEVLAILAERLPNNQP